jgi:hypothetical protein
MFCGCISSSVASLMSWSIVSSVHRRRFVSCSVIIWSWLMLCSLSPPLSYWLRLFLNQTFACVITLAILSHCFFLLTPPIKMEQTECSIMLALKIQMLGTDPKKKIQYCLCSQMAAPIKLMFQTFTWKGKGFHEAVDRSAFCI